MNTLLNFKSFFAKSLVGLAHLGIAINLAALLVGCSAQTYTVGGSITGFTSDVFGQTTERLLLRLNTGEKLSVPLGSTSFRFDSRFYPGDGFSVAIDHQPNGGICTILGTTASGLVPAGGISSVAIECVPLTAPLFSVGGTLLGARTAGMVLQNNARDDLTIDATQTSFKFVTGLPLGANYNVTIKQQPSGYTCAVSNPSGVMNGHISSVFVTCQQNFTVGGSVEGLRAEDGTALVLRNSDGKTVALQNRASTFTFPAVADGFEYLISVAAQPNGEHCDVVPDTSQGTVSGASISSVRVKCVAIEGPLYKITGEVSNLGVGKQLILGNADKEILLVSSGAFTFEPGLPKGAYYDVRVKAQPLGQTCAVVMGSGYVDPLTTTSDITGIEVRCVNNYAVGGRITGLLGSGLVVEYRSPSGYSNFVVPKGATEFKLAAIPDNSAYEIAIAAQPNGENCNIIAGVSGVVSGADLTSAIIECKPISGPLFTISGNVSGLVAGGNLILTNAGKEVLVTSANLNFVFSPGLPYDAYYDVRVKTQPSGQTCTVLNGAGDVKGNVAGIQVECLNNYAIGGSITGLTNGGELVLALNTGERLRLKQASRYDFATKLPLNSAFWVEIVTQPNGRTCQFASGNVAFIEGFIGTTNEFPIVCTP